jgi:hypothetical protein
MRPIIVSEWDRYLAASTSGKKGKLIVVLVYAMRTYPVAGLEIQLHSSLTLALD